jgi:hypothetical protein
VGDLNNDKKLDLVVANHKNHSVNILFGNGDGRFHNQTMHTVGSHPTWVIVADFNNDSKLDLAVATTDDVGVTILFGNGDGTFHNKAKLAVGRGPTNLWNC